MKTVFKIRMTLLMCINLSVLQGYSQEYRYEAGVSVGSASYMGDASESLLRDVGVSCGVHVRYTIDFHWAVSGNLLYARLEGDNRRNIHEFPDQVRLSFRRNSMDLSGQLEFNFFPYSDLYAYKYTRRFTPFISAGIGYTCAPFEAISYHGLNLPFGAGVKYKIRNRMNLNALLTFRKLFNDSFDITDRSHAALDNPYQIKQGRFKNNDWYYFILFSITWDFRIRDRFCH